MRLLRRWLASLILRLANGAISLRTRYAAWLLLRWSLFIMPDVTDAERRAAVQWWDKRGYLWGYCRWPAPLESTGEP